MTVSVCAHVCVMQLIMVQVSVAMMVGHVMHPT